jgi:hypothetical protein
MTVLAVAAMWAGGLAAAPPRAGTVWADRGQQEGVISQVGGLPGPVVALGRYLYWAVGGRVLVLDVSVPGRPKQVGASAPFADRISDLAAAGRGLVATVGSVGTAVLDLDDPLRPRVTGTLPTTGRALTLVAVGDTAFVVERGEGQMTADLVRVIAVNGPGAPREVDRYLSTTPVPITAGVGEFGDGILMVTGGVLWLATADPRNRVPYGLEPFDVSETGRIRSAGPRLIGRFGSTVAIGTHLLTLDFSSAPQLSLYDVANPAAPRLAWQGRPWPADTWTDLRGMWLTGDRAYLAGSDGAQHWLGGIDLGDPLRPRWLGQVETGFGLQSVAGQGERAWASSRWLGTRFAGGLMELAFGAVPSMRAVVESPLPFVSYGGTAVRSGRLYVGEGRLDVFDVTDPAAPRLTGRVPVVGDNPQGLRWLGDQLAVTTDYTITNGVQVVDLERFDVSVPDRPISRGTLRLPSRIMTADDRGRVIIALNNPPAVEIFSVEPGAEPRSLGALQLPSTPQVADLEGDWLFLRLADAIGVVDIADPTAPRLHGQVALPGADSVAASATHLFATAGGRLWVYRRSPVGDLALVASEPVRGNYPQLDGDRMLLAGRGLQVFDVSVPCRPRLQHILETPGGSFQLDGDLLYCHSDAGLYVMRLPPFVPGPPVACGPTPTAATTATVTPDATEPPTATGTPPPTRVATEHPIWLPWLQK